ncbi:MAG: ankyrin repeat domain-containing protein [Pseudomonadota bacterium]
MDLKTMFPDEQLRALAKAAGKGQLKKIDELVAQGVSVNARGRRNATALFWSMRNKEGFTHLLKLGADPNVVFGDGGSVMHWAARKKDCTLLETALKYGGNPNLRAGMFNASPTFETVVHASSSSLSECFYYLLRNGAEINLQDKYGFTVLLTSAAHAEYEMTLELLNLGADYTIQPNNNYSLMTQINKHDNR